MSRTFSPAGHQPGGQGELDRGRIAAEVVADDDLALDPKLRKEAREAEPQRLRAHQVDLLLEDPARVIFAKPGRLDHRPRFIGVGVGQKLRRRLGEQGRPQAWLANGGSPLKTMPRGGKAMGRPRAPQGLNPMYFRSRSDSGSIGSSKRDVALPRGGGEETHAAGDEPSSATDGGLSRGRFRRRTRDRPRPRRSPGRRRRADRDPASGDRRPTIPDACGSAIPDAAAPPLPRRRPRQRRRPPQPRRRPRPRRRPSSRRPRPTASRKTNCESCSRRSRSILTLFSRKCCQRPPIRSKSSRRNAGSTRIRTSWPPMTFPGSTIRSGTRRSRRWRGSPMSFAR